MPSPTPRRLEAQVDSLAFGAATGESVKKVFTVKYEGQNAGAAGADRLIHCKIQVSPPFSVFPPDWKGLPGETFEITLTLPPQTTPGTYTARITIGEMGPATGGPGAMTTLLAVPVTASISSTKGPEDSVGPKPSPPLWNSWIREFPEGTPVQQIETGKSYNFRFDLAAFDYALFFKEAASAGIDTDFNRELSNIPDDTTEVLVIPVLLGHGLKFMPGEQAARKWTIDLERLRRPPTTGTKEDTLPVFADKVNAIYSNPSKTTRASVGVTGSGTGCAAVALTIWKPGFNRPLDHIVRQVSVGSRGSAPACPSAVTASPLKSGLLSLLALPFEQPASAALQIFETRVGSGDPLSAAIFLQEGTPPQILAWNPSRLLSEFVGKDEAQGLRRQIQLARCARKDGGRCVHDYSTVARQLAAVVFQDQDAVGQRNADKALAILKNLSRQGRPDVFVRLVNVEGQLLFLPIGLLGLGSGEFLGRKTNLVNPLPKERVHDPDRCIASWTLVLPDHLADVLEDPFLKPVGADPLDGRLTTWKEFTDYAGRPSGSSRGEGLILLSHHGGGLLSFEPDTIDSLQYAEFKHSYPAGGVAILAGCSVGQLVGDNKGLPLLSRLNDLGIAAAILSPFDVEGPLGARFAFHFADQVERARRLGETSTLLTLYERTVTSIASDDNASDYLPELDEFLIVGDSRISLCPKGTPP
jgi:hypothetical protein